MIHIYLKKLLPFILAAVIALIVHSCARMSSPTGGPKDNDPPVPLKSKPLNYATDVKEDKIIILFDEYISLKNIQQELLVSPPVAEKPEIKQRGKNLVIDINNELKDSTTYNFNFYNSITDLNEGNLLPNFQFEFSTGPEFDSIYIGGVVKNAFDYKTEASLYVMAYEHFNDTMPRTTIPDYIAKTDEDGHFFITNLKSKPYYLFALKDMNNNMLFDLPNESLAFIDSTFQPGFEEMVITDTIRRMDSLALLRNDTIYIDSLDSRTEVVTTIGNVELFMFTEDFEKQYFTQKLRPEKELVVFAFNRELTDSISVIPLSEKAYRSDWFIQERFETNDSLVYWLTDSVLYNNDSLVFQLNYTMKDSNNLDYIKTDTLVLEFEEEEKPENISKKPKEKEKKGGRFNLNILDNKKDEIQEEDTLPPPSFLTFEHNAKPSFDLNAALELIANYPIAKTNTDLIQFNQVVDDTVLVPVAYDFEQSETELRKYIFYFDKDSEESFKVLIPAGTFTDIYGNINDTLDLKFKTRDIEYYSNIQLSLFNVKEKSVILLLDDKETLIEERIIYGDSILNYSYLPPQKYIFKLFYDSNDNDKWDTGNLKELRHAEMVFYFPQEVETKSNWDMEYEWDLYPVAPKVNYGKVIMMPSPLKDREHNHEEHDHEEQDPFKNMNNRNQNNQNAF